MCHRMIYKNYYKIIKISIELIPKTRPYAEFNAFDSIIRLPFDIILFTVKKDYVYKNQF